MEVEDLYQFLESRISCHNNNTIALEYFLKSVTNLSRQIVQEGPKTETQLLQMIGRKSELLHRTKIE